MAEIEVPYSDTESKGATFAIVNLQTGAVKIKLKSVGFKEKPYSEISETLKASSKAFVGDAFADLFEMDSKTVEDKLVANAVKVDVKEPLKE